jgi:hypothetical protein
MKQNKQMYEAPKVELIEMELYGVLCSSSEEARFDGTVMNIDRTADGAWVH